VKLPFFPTLCVCVRRRPFSSSRPFLPFSPNSFLCRDSHSRTHPCDDLRYTSSLLRKGVKSVHEYIIKKGSKGLLTTCVYWFETGPRVLFFYCGVCKSSSEGQWRYRQTRMSGPVHERRSPPSPPTQNINSSAATSPHSMAS
jgi:hypothetical protein